jgi:hypothetical protein
MPVPSQVLEICGEGKTDIGEIAQGEARTEEPPTKGIVPVLVHKLCGEPSTMKVVRRALPFLSGKGMWQKVKFVKQTAFYSRSAGAIFVLDTEGQFPGRLRELIRGRDALYPEFPMAVGVAHPCIETWLLADSAAIAAALSLSALPEVPTHPESLPAPRKNRLNNPKTVLAKCAGGSKVSSKDATRIAQMIADTNLVRQRCPIGFGPFAKEVEERIAPLFH